MLTTEQCEMKFKEIKQKLDYIGNSKSEYMQEHARHLKSLREAYGKEFLKAVDREERTPRITRMSGRGAYYIKGAERSAHEKKGWKS